MLIPLRELGQYWLHFCCLKVAPSCIRTDWFNMCSLPLKCVKAVGNVVKLPQPMCTDFSSETCVMMTLSPVSHTVAHFVVFTVLCLVESLNFSLFYRAGNTCHIKSIFFLSICVLLVKKKLANKLLQTHQDHV